MSEQEGCPVKDWATDYDVLDEEYVRDPVPVWKELRETCPIAHTTRWGGSWLPTKYKDLQTMVRMVPDCRPGRRTLCRHRRNCALN